jgi:transposase
LSTLTRWLSQRREREMEEPDRRSRGEDPAAELKRLRRENEILR